MLKIGDQKWMDTACKKQCLSEMKEISIVLAFDENYALNGAMAIYSAACNVRKGIKIKSYVIDGGVKEKTRKRFERIKRDNLEIVWLNPDLSLFDNLPLSPWTTKIAHARLLIPYIFPDSIKKILYLDSDMLVLKDIAGLWDIPMGNNVLLAVQDYKYPCVHKKPNSRVLIDAGMDPSSPYFNSGLLLIDIPQWRKLDILSRYINLFNDTSGKFTHCDQDPLNIIMKNKWKPLEQHWQVLSPCFHSSDTLQRRIAEDAVIIHFTGTPPGFTRCRHPKKNLFYKYLRFSGWFSGREYCFWMFKLRAKETGYSIDLIQRRLLKRLLKLKKDKP